jgi:DNA-binding response OmpR family regulator
LIVDDEPLILSTYSMILREEGYEVSGCDSYVCGEKQLKERSYDAAVTGINAGGAGEEVAAPASSDPFHRLPYH